MFKIFNFLKKKEEIKRPKTLMGTLGIFYWSNTYPLLPRFICADGFELSIQYNLAGQRDVNTLELGCLSKFESLLDQYAEDKGRCDTAFSYVPISLVRHIVEDLHGGIINCKNLKTIEDRNKKLNVCIPQRGDILPFKISDTIIK